MTDLYNENPVWLANAHATLDQAVAAAYGWTDYTTGTPTDTIISRLLTLNHVRSSDLFAESERRLRPAAVPAKGADRPVKSRGPENRPTTQGDMFNDTSASRSSKVTPLARFPPGENIRKPPIRANRQLINKRSDKRRRS